MAAPTYIGTTAIQAGTAGADLTLDFTALFPQADDILIVLGWQRTTSGIIFISDTDGWTSFAEFSRSTVSDYAVMYARDDGGAAVDRTPLVQFSGSADTYAMGCIVRGCITTEQPFQILNVGSTATADPSNHTGGTPTFDEALILVLIGQEDNNNTGVTVTSTNPSAYTEIYAESATGSDGTVAFAHGAQTTAAATGDITVDWSSAATPGCGVVIWAMKPPTPASGGRRITHRPTRLWHPNKLRAW